MNQAVAMFCGIVATVLTAGAITTPYLWLAVAGLLLVMFGCWAAQSPETEHPGSQASW